MYKLSNRSAGRLSGVHPLLVACVVLAMRRHSTVDFGVANDCVRTLKRQHELVESGASKTLDSYHLLQEETGYSHAVDLYPSGYKSIDAIPNEAWFQLASAMESAAERLGIKVNWGYAMWGWDKPHFQLEV